MVLPVCAAAPAAIAAPATAPRHAVHAVAIEAMQFVPARLEVHPGDTVVWTNRDPYPHTVASDAGGFRSGTIGPGKSWRVIVRRAGTFPYVCTLHGTMKAELVSMPRE